MTRQTFELFAQEVMTTGRIPIGNSSGRAPIPRAKQILVFLWSTANEEPTQTVADRFNITLSSVNHVLQRINQTAIDLSGRYIR